MVHNHKIAALKSDAGTTTSRRIFSKLTSYEDVTHQDDNNREGEANSPPFFLLYYSH